MRCRAFGFLLLVGVTKSCTYYDKGTKSTFDLAPLKMGESSSYSVKDMFDTLERNYTYVFNVCANAKVPDKECKPTEAGGGASPAFQVFNDGSCWRLGKHFEDVEFELLDADDPTQGVTMTYLHGDVCHLDVDVARSMTIKFKCSESWGKVPEATVTEDTCNYELTFETVFGCPLECPFANRKLCGGNGFCGMDLDNGAPKCFCNEGHSGSDCTTPVTGNEGCGAICGALVLVLFLLVGLLGAGLVIFYRVHKLSLVNTKFDHMMNERNIEETFSLQE